MDNLHTVNETLSVPSYCDIGSSESLNNGLGAQTGAREGVVDIATIFAPSNQPRLRIIETHRERDMESRLPECADT